MYPKHNLRQWDIVKCVDAEQATDILNYGEEYVVESINGYQINLFTISTQFNYERFEITGRKMIDSGKIETQDAIRKLVDALQTDPDYAWSWQCNIAVAAQDEGLNHLASNKAAARFLYNLASVDMTKHEHFPKPNTKQARFLPGDIVVFNWDGTLSENESHSIDRTIGIFLHNGGCYQVKNCNEAGEVTLEFPIGTFKANEFTRYLKEPGVIRSFFIDSNGIEEKHE